MSIQEEKWLEPFLKYMANNKAISPDDVKYGFNFCQSFEYLNYLRKFIQEETGEAPLFIGSNYFADIMFIFENTKSFELFKTDLFEMLKDKRIARWETYMTLIHKTNQNISSDIVCVKGEILAVEPKAVYLVGVSQNDFMYLQSILQNEPICQDIKFVSTDSIQELTNLFIPPDAPGLAYSP